MMMMLCLYANVRNMPKNRSLTHSFTLSQDVFLSGDVDDTRMAIDMVQVWLKNKKFL